MPDTLAQCIEREREIAEEARRHRDCVGTLRDYRAARAATDEAVRAVEARVAELERLAAEMLEAIGDGARINYFGSPVCEPTIRQETAYRWSATLGTTPAPTAQGESTNQEDA